MYYNHLLFYLIRQFCKIIPNAFVYIEQIQVNANTIIKGNHLQLFIGKLLSIFADHLLLHRLNWLQICGKWNYISRLFVCNFRYFLKITITKLYLTFYRIFINHIWIKKNLNKFEYINTSNRFIGRNDLQLTDKLFCNWLLSLIFSFKKNQKWLKL